MHQLENIKEKLVIVSILKKGQRQMIIEREILRHQLETVVEREDLFKNNLGDHQAWLNNFHQNMGRQVHQLVEKTFYVIKSHHCMNDQEMAAQARAIVLHLLKVLLNLYETLRGQINPQESDED